MKRVLRPDTSYIVILDRNRWDFSRSTIISSEDSFLSFAPKDNCLGRG